MTQELETNMRVAFRKALFSNPKDLFKATHEYVIKSLNAGRGSHKPKRLWDAKLSFRTYQSLKNKGFVQ